MMFSPPASRSTDPVETDKPSRAGGAAPSIANFEFSQTVINHDGTVALCCSVYYAPNMLGVDFLAHSHTELERRKYEHPVCSRCIKANLHYTRPELRPAATGGSVSA